MRPSISPLRRFVCDDAGATAVEYGLLLAVLSLVIIGGVELVGGALNGRFTFLATKLAAS